MWGRRGLGGIGETEIEDVEREVVVGVSVRIEKGLDIKIRVVVERERVVDEEGGADKEVGGRRTDDIEEEECERTSENTRRGAGVVLCT